MVDVPGWSRGVAGLVLFPLAGSCWLTSVKITLTHTRNLRGSVFRGDARPRDDAVPLTKLAKKRRQPETPRDRLET